MKKLLYYFSFILLIACISCEKDFLDTSSPSKLSSETVFKTSSMAKAGIMGVYGRMTESNVYGQKLSVNWQGFSDIETNQGFASGTAYNSNTSDQGTGNFYGDPNNQTTRWNVLFQLAELASASVDGVRNSPILESQASKMKPLLGEALVMRSLAYFELVRYWGDIPFKEGTSKSDLSNVYIGKIDRDIIYASLIKDLTEAVDYLPWLNADAEHATVERITKGYAKGLLAKVALFAGGWSLRDGNLFPGKDLEHNPNIPEANGYYVGRVKNWREYYQIASQQTAEVLGSAANPHKLDPDYENIWKTVCGLKQNPHNENLFEIAFGIGNNGDIGSLMGYEVAGASKYGSRGFGGTYAGSQAYYFYSFTPEDKRRDVTLSWTNYTSANVEGVKSDPLSVNFAKWRIYWMSPSYLALHKTATSRVATGVNWILMRYSDIYLMYAEAQSQLNGPDSTNPVAQISARQALEKVRERAFGTGSSKIKEYDANFFEAIVNERAWEFGCENIRKQDLIRWGLLYDRIETMKQTLCLMLDNKVPVKIFDKTYQPTDFPKTVYYKFKDAEYIDKSSLNYYTNLPASPGPEYKSVSWFPTSAAKPLSGTNKNYIDWPVKVLLAATGLSKEYDYSGFLSRMSNGGEIATSLSTYSMGNRTCNYRSFYAVYYQDVYESKGAISNSYGF